VSDWPITLWVALGVSLIVGVIFFVIAWKVQPLPLKKRLLIALVLLVIVATTTVLAFILLPATSQSLITFPLCMVGLGLSLGTLIRSQRK
jgi:predicted neutral ceramidase superfamily lipid hydrolase